MSVDRRELFKIIGAGLTAAELSAQHEHRTPTTRKGDYEPRVLNASQYATLQRLLEILLPQDETSPSARQAGVGMYIDTTLKYGDDTLRTFWIAGLAAVDEAARNKPKVVPADRD
ncbi:MAG: gluconate 2-dehydrogenase subunit 3 family protein [Bryobacteraceae bacterium]